MCDLYKNTRLILGKKKQFKKLGGWFSGYVKPSGKIWKRIFNKRVRTGKATYKRDNWMEWS